MTHILERFFIHFFASCSLVVMTFYAFRYWAAHNKQAALWLPDTFRRILAISALAVFSLATLREPVDVAMGQSLIKAFTDFLSWFLGCSVSAWGLYRFLRSK